MFSRKSYFGKIDAFQKMTGLAVIVYVGLTGKIAFGGTLVCNTLCIFGLRKATKSASFSNSRRYTPKKKVRILFEKMCFF